MKKIMVCVLLCLAASLWFCGCRPAKPTLHIYNWADYLKPELVLRFVQHVDQFARIVIERIANPVNDIYLFLRKVYFHSQRFPLIGHILEYGRSYICFLTHIIFLLRVASYGFRVVRRSSKL